MAGVATALVTVAGISSVTYQLTRFMLYKAAEASANTALALLARRTETVGEVQFILMELDVEAKFKSVSSLLSAVERDEVDTRTGAKSFIMVSCGNVREAMASVQATLRRIQGAMDQHAGQWLSRFRSLDVVDDLHLLKAQCRMFDKRLETLIQCLAVPPKGGATETRSASQHGLGVQRIFGDSMLADDDNPETERMKHILLAERAIKDAEADVRLEEALEARREVVRDRPSAPPQHHNNPRGLIFEDPVFL